jgi:hypothetical protein
MLLLSTAATLGSVGRFGAARRLPGFMLSPPGGGIWVNA